MRIALVLTAIVVLVAMTSTSPSQQQPDRTPLRVWQHQQHNPAPPSPRQNREVSPPNDVIKQDHTWVAVLLAPAVVPNPSASHRAGSNHNYFGGMFRPIASRSRFAGIGFHEADQPKPVGKSKVDKYIRRLKTPKGYSANYFLSLVA